MPDSSLAQSERGKQCLCLIKQCQYFDEFSERDGFTVFTVNWLDANMTLSETLEDVDVTTAPDPFVPTELGNMRRGARRLVHESKGIVMVDEGHGLRLEDVAINIVSSAR
jgi:hypothetical protein